uniref:Uncharacterized protein n=1 Tax=Arundo donax TaxID=35708 RepID=A0A0A9BAM3_ARUDO
MAILSLRP